MSGPAQISDLCETNVVLRGESGNGKSWLVELLSRDRPAQWVPKKLVTLESNGDGKSWRMTCPEWLAREKGFL